MSRNMTPLLLLSSLALTSAIPLSFSTSGNLVLKRNLTPGAKAGLGVGIAVGVILVVLLTAFFVIHLRHVRIRNRERALEQEKIPGAIPPPINTVPATTKPGSGPHITTTPIPRRQKSVKDRLMGPLYQGSNIDLQNIKGGRGAAINTADVNRVGGATMADGDFDKPWAADGEAVGPTYPSYSSKRATRMMMMM